VVAIGWPSECGRYAAVSPQRSHSVPASQAMIWMGAASAPSCGLGGVRGRQRSAMSVSAWDGPSRRATHGWSGLGVRSERHVCGCVRCAAESRRAATARSGIIGLTIRDSSWLPSDGRRNAAGMRPSLRGEAIRMHRCEVRVAATTWLRRVRAFRALGMGVARLAGCDSLARKRPAKRTKARIPPECSSSSIATGRRERPPRQAAQSSIRCEWVRMWYSRVIQGSKVRMGANGCEWVRMWYSRVLQGSKVRMGANGCEWVLMGANADLRGSPLLERRYFGI
jgi:hypothetical protein